MDSTIIRDNPFRMLGVYVNARQSDIVRNVNKIKAFLHVGRGVSFPTDSLLGLPAPERSEETIAKAQSALDLPKDRLRHGFFWIGDETVGDDWIPVLNSAVSSLAKGDVSGSVSSYLSLLHDEKLRVAFIRSVCGDAFTIPETDVASVLWTTLLEMVPGKDLLPYLTEEDAWFVREHTVSEAVGSIKNEIALAWEKKTNRPDDMREMGIRLMNQTRSSLQRLKEVTGPDNPEYRSAADALSRQILQCGINYFNGVEGTPDEIRRARTLLEYAQNLACGPMVKERCKMNLDTLKSREDHVLYQEEVDAVTALVRPFAEGEMKVMNLEAADKLCASAAPHLAALKAKVGKESDTYLSLTSLVANTCTNIIVDMINGLQKYAKDKGAMRGALKWSDQIMNTLKGMDLRKEDYDRIDKNQKTLQTILSGIKPKVGIWVYVIIILSAFSILEVILEAL